MLPDEGNESFTIIFLSQNGKLFQSLHSFSLVKAFINALRRISSAS
jgi:hypothetical protein